MDEEVITQLRNASHVNENLVFDAAAVSNLQEDLKSRWDSIIPCPTNDEPKGSTCNAWFRRIYEQHNQSWRFYHTPVHLKEMLDYLEILQQCAVVTNEQAIPMTWAVFFHDVVYDPKSACNEKDSALLFKEFSKAVSLGDHLTDVVETMILATEKHKIILMAESPRMEDALALFLDLDMAVLGKNRDAYLAYAALIRKEYSFVDSTLYCEKRAEILQNFLNDSESIYQTLVFQEAMEKAARDNLKAEINLLQQGQIPGSKTN